MKFKIFTKAILTIGLLSNPYVLNSMEWHREAPDDPTPKKSIQERARELETLFARPLKDTQETQTENQRKQEIEETQRKLPDDTSTQIKQQTSIPVVQVELDIQKKERVKKLEKIKPEEFFRDKNKYMYLIEYIKQQRNLLETTEGTPAIRDIILKDIQEQEKILKKLEEKYGKPLTEFANLKDAIEFNRKVKPAERVGIIEQIQGFIRPKITPIQQRTSQSSPLKSEPLKTPTSEPVTTQKPVVQPIDLEAALKETNRQIATQEAENKKIDKEINRLQSELRALNKKKSSKSNEAKITALKTKLEEAQRKANSGTQRRKDLVLKKSAQIKQKTDELQSLQEELDKLRVNIGDPTKVIQEQLIHMQEIAEAEKKYIASLEGMRQNPESVIAFFEKAIKQREAALKAQSSKGLFERVEGQAESPTAKKVRESTEAELAKIRAYVEKIKNAQSQTAPVIDEIIKEYQSSYAESTRKSDELIKQRDSKETKQKSLEYQGKIAALEQRIADGFTNSYSAARELFIEQKDTGHAKLYTQAFAAKGFALNAKLEELKKKRPQTKEIKSQISSLKKQIKSLTKDNSNKSIKKALRTNFGNITNRDHRIWLGEFVAE